MTTIRSSLDQTSSATRSSSALLDRGELVRRPVPLWARAASRIRATSLDGRLAGGESPQASRLLAARTHYLLAPSYRLQLAVYWCDRVEWASRPPQGLSGRVPLRRDRLLSAQRELRGLVTALIAMQTPAVRGVAMARILLTDGLGPLYNRHDATDLGAALREATERMG